MRRPRTPKAPAQAIVEFALASTVIFFLLAAVVDLGLIYFTLQSLRVAAQEGATFGSYPRVTTITSGNRQTFNVTINYPEIIYRVYGAGGEQVGGFANLRDLNGNGIDDLTEKLHDNMTNPTAYIYIENLRGATPAFLNPANSCRGDTQGKDLQNGGVDCWIRVTVRYDYKFIFPLAPAFQDTVQLRASHLTQMRSTVYTSSQ
jgi:hypothetical protein